MNNFYDFLASAIQDEAARYITSEQDHLRVIFSALPADMLEAIYMRMNSKGPRLALKKEGLVKSVPVLLVQQDADDPSSDISARCTSNHVIKIRTASGTFLALLAVNDPPLLSADSTVNYIGLTRNDHQTLTGWRQEPFIDRVIKAVLGRYSGIDKAVEDVFDKALEEAWEDSGQMEEYAGPWKLLQALYDAGNVGKGAESFCATLGLPKLVNSEAPDLTINKKIAEYFSEHGINQGTLLLQEEASRTDIAEALEAFKISIIERYRTPQEFNSSPILNYARASKGQNASWWEALSQAIWIDLLNHSDVTEQGTLRVTCAYELYSQAVKSHPVVVNPPARFMLEPDETLKGQEVTVFRASGRKSPENLGKVWLGDDKILWEDTSEPCEHSQFLKYEFRTNNIDKPASVKVIDLDGFTPGVTLNCRSAVKMGPFKRKVPRGRKSKRQPAYRYECDLVTNGTGTHTIDLYHRSGTCLSPVITGYFGDDEPSVDKNIKASHDGRNHAVCVIETSEECYYDFHLEIPGEADVIHFRINIIASEFVAKGASSEFEKLVIQNCTGSTRTVSKVDARQTMLTGFESWLLEHAESYHPVILGPGFKENWQVPSWKEYPVISSLGIYLDPRPSANEFDPPEEFLACREQVRQYLSSQCDDKSCSLEALSLGQMMLDSDTREMISRYIGLYVSWLNDDFLAAWSDVVIVHKAEQPNKCLESKPLAVLLSPLHPVRLAWQCNAQDILQDAIKQGQPCPIAGIMDPSTFPDCLALPCRDVNGQYLHVGYAAVKSTTDYWSVLWREDMIQEVEKANSDGVFGHDLGISIEGMVNGFNKQQVKRSLDEIRQLAPAKSRLRISLHSDSSGYSSCNEGIDEWCMENLGSEQDEWAEAGALTLQVLDARPTEEQPEPAILASLTERSGTSVRWHTRAKLTDAAPRDLSIVDHLQTIHQEFRVDKVYSAVDPSCVTRLSVKKNAHQHQRYLSMSRVGKFVTSNEGNKLQVNLAKALSLLEGACTEHDLFDSLGFAPNMGTLDESLRGTRYSAISSSAVDASCFHQPGKDAYLWDYELPRYAPGSGQESGFYLIAAKSDSMLKVMRNALGKFNEGIIPSDEQIVALLNEISKRGIPTLKRLTSGGSASLGEIGMLVATRFLQSEFQDAEQGRGLIPALGDSKINLVIPADVFQARFDGLRSALDVERQERPDLLVMSIAFAVDAGDELLEPVKLKITPIEVKTRSGEMSDNQRRSALDQASVFSAFLEQLKRYSEEQKKDGSKRFPLWGIAYRDMLASWLDYGFRVYGETSTARKNFHWVRYHQDTLARLMGGDLEVEIDPIGRLISIESISKCRVISTRQNGTDDTLILDYSSASALLAGDQQSVVSLVADRVVSWGLLADITKATPVTSLQNITEAEVATQEDKKTVVGAPTQVFPADTAKSPVKISNEEGDASVPGICFKVGEATELLGNKDVMFYPGNTDLTNINIGVVGDLGTGKTQLLKSLVYQMVKYPENNRGVAPKVLILDYKRDFSDTTDNSCSFIDKAQVKVVLPTRLPLNLFNSGGNKAPTAWLDRYAFFRDILRKIFGVNAPVQDERLKQAVKSSFKRKQEDGLDPTIYDVFEEYKAVINGKPDAVYGIMSDIVDYEIFEKDPSKIVPFDQFFDGVVAVDLSLFSDDKLKKMVIVIFLNLYYDYMLKVQKQPFLGKDPETRFIDSYLLVDEAHNIMPYEFPVLSKLLLQGRAFGVGVILASQYFSHFKTKNVDYREPFHSWFIHKVPGVTARDLDMIGLPSVGDRIIDRVASLGKFESLCKTLGYSGEFIKEVPFYQLD